MRREEGNREEWKWFIPTPQKIWESFGLEMGLLPFCESRESVPTTDSLSPKLKYRLRDLGKALWGLKADRVPQRHTPPYTPPPPSVPGFSLFLPWLGYK